MTNRGYLSPLAQFFLQRVNKNNIVIRKDNMHFYKEIDIESYLRNFIYLKILKFLDKTSCAKCCSKDNLCIHHNKELEFSTMLYKSLEDLNIEYKERYCDYSKKELKSLETMMLGYQLYGEITILCKNCHVDLHKKEFIEDYKIKYRGVLKKYKWQLEYYRNLFPDSSLDDFLNNFNQIYLNNVIDKFIGTKMFNDDRSKLKNILSKDLIREHINKSIRQKLNKDTNISKMGIDAVNIILLAYNTGYRIISLRWRKNTINKEKRYWLLSKIDENINV